jgi:hypothetical protein
MRVTLSALPSIVLLLGALLIGYVALYYVNVRERAILGDAKGGYRFLPIYEIGQPVAEVIFYPVDQVDNFFRMQFALRRAQQWMEEDEADLQKSSKVPRPIN